MGHVVIVCLHDIVLKVLCPNVTESRLHGQFFQNNSPRYKGSLRPLTYILKYVTYKLLLKNKPGKEKNMAIFKETAVKALVKAEMNSANNAGQAQALCGIAYAILA